MTHQTKENNESGENEMQTQKKCNVAILNHHAGAPDTGRGGRHYELGKYLSEKGYCVTILASSYIRGRKIYKYNVEIKDTRINENFRFISFKTKPVYTNIVGRFLNYIDYKNKAGKFDDFKEKPDIIIASSVHPLAWIAGYKLSKKYNSKFIVEVRDLWPLSMYEDFTGIIRKLVFTYFESLEREYYKLADAIVTTAPYAYEYIEERYGIDRDKVFYIPHGIDIDNFDADANLSEEILDTELKTTLDSYFCVTYTGAFSKSEGLHTFIESAKHLKRKKDIRLVLVGSGNERKIIDDIIKKEDLDNVVIIERQPKNTMALTLKKSKILICGLMDRKAFKYGISKNKFYDYMAAKKPIIFASNVRGSLISKADAGITIKPGDPENLANTIIYLYENINSIGEQFGNNGRTYVEKHHTNKIIVEKFIEVIHNC